MGILDSLLSGFELGAEPDTIPDLSPDENFMLQMPQSPLGNLGFPQTPTQDPAQPFSSPDTVPTAPVSEAAMPNAGPFGESLGTPSGQTPPPPPDPDAGVQRFLQILALLTGLGGIGGVAQNLLGGRPATTATPRLSPEQLSLLTGAQSQFGTSGSLLQSLMGAMATPQIPPALSALVEQSFQPQLGDIATLAIESARRRGFSGGAELLNTGPGGAIAGPPLAALQGQMAAQKLNLYQNNIGNLLQALDASRRLASAQGGLATGLPSGRQTLSPKPSILQTMGEFSPVLGEIAGILEPGKKEKKTGSGLSQVP